MPIEIDQSNKIERTNKDTVLAFSNGQSRAIVIPAQVKQTVVAYLVQRGKTRKAAYLLVFSAGLFVLVRGYLAQKASKAEQLIIDTEYTGQEANIKGMLLRLSQKQSLALKPEGIRFAQVGKASKAHKLAWDVQRGKAEADYRVTDQDLLTLL